MMTLAAAAAAPRSSCAARGGAAGRVPTMGGGLATSYRPFCDLNGDFGDWRRCTARWGLRTP